MRQIASHYWIMVLLVGWGRNTAAGQRPLTRPSPGINELLADLPRGDLQNSFDLLQWGVAGYHGEPPEIVAEVRGDMENPDVAVGPVTRRFVDTEGQPAFTLEMQVCATHERVVARLTDWLTNSAPVWQIKRIDGLIGDRAFLLSPSPRGGSDSESRPGLDAGADVAAVNTVVFKLGNVAFRLQGHERPREKPANLLDVVKTLALHIKRSPTEAFARPRKLVLSGAPGCVAGESIPLKLTIKDAEAESLKGWLITWVMRGDGHAYIEKDSHGERELVTTGPGSVAVTVVGTAPDGRSTSTTRTFTVREDP